MKKLLPFVLLLVAACAHAQVKIGNNPNTINANALLELESTNKGFLPPRVALNSTADVAPLTGAVTAGMLVYSTGGTLPDGYYYWNGTAWKLVATSELNTVSKTADATLLKTENFVLASNDIELTLPAITASDNGLSITVKNVGSHTDLITVKGDGSATIDESDSSTLTRYVGQTFVATGGNWVIKNKEKKSGNLLDVSSNSSWTTIQEVVEFLEEHMAGATVVRLGEDSFGITSTININLPYPLTFQGLSYGTTTLAAASGLANKPMFRCISDCYFKMMQFDATTLSGYGTAAGEDAIRLVGNGTYNEVKDCTFDRFYSAILDSTNAELWVFETDISNAQNSGIRVHSNVAGVTVKVAETDFIGCKRGVFLEKGTGATIQLASGGYYNTGGTDTAIVYRPADFSSFTSISITGNSWNNTGKYIEGFDFTRTDGRDANAIVESNAGTGDKRPNCTINVLNSNATTTLTTTNAWYKVTDFTGTTTTSTCKWTISGNRITFQPNNRRDGTIVIAGNVSVNGNNKTISIGIVKNNASGTRYGETTLRITVQNQPFQFSSVVSLSDIGPNDYFELFASTTSGGDIITIQDIQWLVNTQ
jgi:roadblock/LC7 domain-containing protein